MSDELKKRIFTSILLILLLFAMYFYSFVMITTLVVVFIILWIEFLALISKIFQKNKFKDKVLRFLYKAMSLLYLLSLFFFIIVVESYYQNLKLFIIYSVLTAILSDIGGLVFGKTFKGRKLTKISPNKTIAGSIGSFIFSLLLIPIFYQELIVFNILTLVIITLIISFASQLGDLFISFLKRKAKVKDTSDLLPGHGGFLDRLDGVILSIPVGFIMFVNF
jgi:phosphatidate cytidylyltransferase